MWPPRSRVELTAAAKESARRASRCCCSAPDLHTIQCCSLCRRRLECCSLITMVCGVAERSRPGRMSSDAQAHCDRHAEMCACLRCRPLGSSHCWLSERECMHANSECRAAMRAVHRASDTTETAGPGSGGRRAGRHHCEQPLHCCTRRLKSVFSARFVRTSNGEQRGDDPNQRIDPVAHSRQLATSTQPRFLNKF